MNSAPLTDGSLFNVPITIFSVLLTLAAYATGLWLYRRTGYQTLLQPVISGIILVILALSAFEVPYTSYLHGADIIHTLLGTATVALAIPLYENLPRIRQNWQTILLGLLAAGVLAVVTALGIAWSMGADEKLLLSLAPKSITTPFAIAVSEMIGGYPSLTAAFVIFTGMVVAVGASPIFKLLRIEDPVVQGSALGMIGHGIGTARAFELGPQCGALSALSMGLMGLYTSVCLPWFISLFFHS